MRSTKSVLASVLGLALGLPIAALADTSYSPPKTLVNLKIEGGLAAGLVHLDVSVDAVGGVHASGHGKSGIAMLAPADFEAFKDALHAVKWTTIPKQVKLDPQGMDMPTDKIKYSGAGMSQSVTLEHFPHAGGPKAPASLVRVFDLLAAIGAGALGDANLDDVKLSVDAKPGADGAAFALHVRNTSARTVALPVTHFGGTKFEVNRGAESVYDSEAHKYYALFMLPPALHVLAPGADWTVDGSWSYVRNVWGSDDRSRVAGGTYKVRGDLAVAGAKDGKISSPWTSFEVPEDELAKSLLIKLTKSVEKESGTVKLTLRLTNLGKKSLTLDFPLSPAHAFEITEVKSGKVVFHDDGGPTSPLKLKPGASETFTTDWNFTNEGTGKKVHGAFKAVVRIFTEPERKSNTVAFVYEPAHAAAAGGGAGPGILDAIHHASGAGN